MQNSVRWPMKNFVDSGMGSVPGFIILCVLVGFCTCRPRLSSYDNSSACVVMWFKLRRLGG